MIDAEQFFCERVQGWLAVALFCKDRHEACAAASNLMRALRNPEGRSAAMIAIADSPNLTELFLPRVWALRQRLMKSFNPTDRH